MTSAQSTELIEVFPVEGVTVIRFLRRILLDPLAIEAAGDTLAAALRADHPLVLLDFSRVESVPSAVLGRVLALHKSVEAAGGRVAFCGVGPRIAQIFALCRMPASIGVHPDEASGVAALRG
ncbi:MAG: STAS domain-containing protein [Gemmataceae bacterium]